MSLKELSAYFHGIHLGGVNVHHFGVAGATGLKIWRGSHL
jgi:hypothetical protein